MKEMVMGVSMKMGMRRGRRKEIIGGRGEEKRERGVRKRGVRKWEKGEEKGRDVRRRRIRESLWIKIVRGKDGGHEFRHTWCGKYIISNIC